MNWLDCSVIERVPGKLSGQPVIRRSRVRPEDLLNNLDMTEDEMAEEFGLLREDVREVLDFYHRNKEQLADTP